MCLNSMSQSSMFFFDHLRLDGTKCEIQVKYKYVRKTAVLCSWLPAATYIIISTRHVCFFVIRYDVLSLKPSHFFATSEGVFFFGILNTAETPRLFDSRKTDSVSRVALS